MVKIKKRRYEVGKREIRGLKARVGQECCISSGGPDGLSSTMEIYMLEEDTVLVSLASPEEAGRAASGVKAV